MATVEQHLPETHNGIVGTGETAERSRNPARRLSGAAEVRKLTASLTVERPEPAVRRPSERTAADRTENGAGRGRCIVHSFLPGVPTL